MVKDLKFERIAQLIALAAIDRNDRCVLEKFSVPGSASGRSGANQSVGCRWLIVRFSNYVKSQIHLCIVEDLFGRSIIDYINAAKYLQGYKMYRESAEKVLKYFYADMSRFLINNLYDVLFKVVVDVDFDTESVNVGEVKAEFERLLEMVNSSGLYQGLSEFKYAGIVDSLSSVESIEDAKMKIDSYVVAAVLHEQARSSTVRALKMEDWYADKSE